MADLKPCPFCGANNPEIVHIEGTILHPAYFVRCGYCGAQAPWSDKGDHVAKWNKRATEIKDKKMTDKCKGLTGWLFGHDYRIAVDGRQLYLGHVCRRCGHKIIKEL